MNLTNPFVVSGYVSPEYFCDRVEESENLTRYLTNGRNIALISTRRMGKTGLIRHCFQDKEIEANYYTFFIDIYSTASLREFVFALGKEIFEQLKPRGKKFIDQFFSIITSLRAGFRLDTLSGEPTFELGLGDIGSANITLDEIFRYLELADKKCIVAIDEFQQIAHYPDKNVEAVLRTLIQGCKNTSFIFAGSQQHVMSNLFQSPARPFYQSVNIMHLNEIDSEIYTNFVVKHFESYNKSIETEAIHAVYSMFEGHTWYLQIIFNELFSLTKVGNCCDLTMTQVAVNHIVSVQEFTYQEILYRLPAKQKEILISIAKEGKARAVTSADFIKKYKLKTPSSVQAAIKYLLDKDLITHEKNVYQIYDRFFGLWLNSQY